MTPEKSHALLDQATAGPDPLDALREQGSDGSTWRRRPSAPDALRAEVDRLDDLRTRLDELAELLLDRDESAAAEDLSRLAGWLDAPRATITEVADVLEEVLGQ